MQLQNSFTVPVPVDVAWRVLLDVEQIAPCMPGAAVESVEADVVHGRVKVKLGPIAVTYRGTVTFVERDEGSHRVVMSAAAKEARGSGTAAATITAVLQDRGDHTDVVVDTDLQVTGKPAQFGRGVMADVSKNIIQQFADCLATELEGGSLGTPTSESAATTPSVTGGATTERPAEPASPGARPVPVRAPDDALDLFGTMSGPLAKRAAPLAVGIVFLVLLTWLRRSGRG